MHKTNGVLDPESHPWCLIGGAPQTKESFERALARNVQKEAGIKIENIEFISEFRYHSVLTDDNVNKMQRKEFQLLDFFTLKELQKLSLTESTREFISNSESLINKVSL